MPRTFLLLMSMVGMAVIASGQSLTAPVQVTAEKVDVVSATTVQFRGSVRIVTGDAVITADEADARTTGPNGATDFELRGNVHFIVNPKK